MNHNRSTALERSVKKLLGGLKPVLRVPNLALSFYHGSKHTVVWSAWRFSNSSMDHHVKQINHRINTDVRTRQKRVATDTWRSLRCRTTPLEHWSKRKPTVEPRWAKQQTKNLRPKPTKINSFMSGPLLSLTPTHRRAIKDGSKVINRDWVKH